MSKSLILFITATVLVICLAGCNSASSITEPTKMSDPKTVEPTKSAAPNQVVNMSLETEQLSRTN